MWALYKVDIPLDGHMYGDWGFGYGVLVTFSVMLVSRSVIVSS